MMGDEEDDDDDWSGLCVCVCVCVCVFVSTDCSLLSHGGVESRQHMFHGERNPGFPPPPPPPFRFLSPLCVRVCLPLCRLYALITPLRS
jgi:hypothetical protein